MSGDMNYKVRFEDIRGKVWKYFRTEEADGVFWVVQPLEWEKGWRQYCFGGIEGLKIFVKENLGVELR